ncbi:MAG: AAA family ATPase [Pseudomonadota bacterium]
MTWYKPTLILTRLLITKSGGAVYDEKYHYGLNVIRGSNSSGKTTISRAIVYALGGDIKQWTPELLSCDFVIAEVSINREFVTLRRAVDDEKRSPMEIYWGSYIEASNASPASWERYPYANYENKKGFSKVLFEALELPEVKGYQESNVTMHQVLRLMYGDQSSPATKILGTEDFDSTITRESIGDLLCGIYSDALFNARTRLKIVDAQVSSVVSNLKNLYRILGKENTDIKSLNIEAEIDLTRNQIEDAKNENDKIKATGYIQESNEQTKKIRDALQKSKIALYTMQERNLHLTFDISDSEIFINELQNKVKGLNDSIAVATVINTFSYKNCPACYTDLSNLKRIQDECSLCGTQLEKETSAINFHKIRNEIEMQIKESRKLLEHKKEEARELKGAIRVLTNETKSLDYQYREIATDIASDKQKKLQENYKKIGYLERSIEDLEKTRGIIEQIKEVADLRDRLNHEKSELHDFIDQNELKQDARRREIALKISEAVVGLLRQDLSRQDQFSAAETVQFDFGANSVSVDGETTFSESSTVFLKNAFLLGLLAVSARDERLRFPRFLLLDGIENGGMERERSHNLQRVILALSDSLEVDHQIIITTAEVSPDIEKSAAPVGDFYTSANRSLKFARV